MINLHFNIFFYFLFIGTVISQNGKYVGITTSEADQSIPEIFFNNLTEKDGLSYNLITDMIQDKDGLLWVSTLFGLNRYDGKRFDVFKRNRNDKNSIQQNIIYSICEDKNTNIWSATEDGLICFDKKLNAFISIIQQDTLRYPRINVLVCDNNNNIWAGSNDGLIKYEIEKRKFTYFGYNPKHKHSITDSKISKKKHCA
jgi:ligand-binding sensor domain-containing protein